MIQRTISPIDGSIYLERELLGGDVVDALVERGKEAQLDWKCIPISERAEICRRFVEIMLEQKEELGAEITHQMGRPIRYTANEIVGMADRATKMIDLAESELTDLELAPKDGFTRFIRREPLGLIFAIVPWNYPYLTAINTLVPAIMAGNSVLLKHSPQTMVCAERLYAAFHEAGLMEGVFQYLHVNIEDTQRIIKSPLVDFVAFTGSVAVGHEVQKAASGKFIGVGLELGGKDPAYIRADANLSHAVENVIDGVMFNSGQSCCAVERIYVHEDLYDEFVEEAIKLTNTYILGNPLEHETTLGPMVRTSSADFVRGQIADAVAAGATTLIDESLFPLSVAGTPYLAPQLLVDVDHTMRIMTEESFGPVAGIMKVHSDEEAIQLMNDSAFGLTASIWTADEEAALRIGDQLQTGTVFMNRCDFLDPELAWVGVKNSGRGCTLSRVGYEFLTRPKSFHLRTKF